MVIYEYEVPGGALNLKATNYPDHGRQGDLPLRGKIPMAEPGIETGPHDNYSENMTSRKLGLSLLSKVCIYTS
jgi:hypothetical protein